jgi:hypothetical protein
MFLLGGAPEATPASASCLHLRNPTGITTMAHDLYDLEQRQGIGSAKASRLEPCHATGERFDQNLL